LAAVFVSLLGPLMLPTTFTVVFLEGAASQAIRYSSPVQADWVVPPEPPPPRS